MATQDRFLKLLASETDEELEAEIAKMQDNQKTMMIKAFIKMIKGYNPVTQSYDKDKKIIFKWFDT